MDKDTLEKALRANLNALGFDVETETLTPVETAYDDRVAAYEREGMTRSDAQGVVDAEDLRGTDGSDPSEYAARRQNNATWRLAELDKVFAGHGVVSFAGLKDALMDRGISPYIIGGFRTGFGLRMPDASHVRFYDDEGWSAEDYADHLRDADDDNDGVDLRFYDEE
jgi:hypothetical protein